mmetsp:Transcript_68850/g.128500  ORF Transcript_68850/g.128500 Transcript_68850/m.128500 type:complete len:439 (+) Transcript_68850:87-1403(+)
MNGGMDITYERVCQQLGLQAHPEVLADFALHAETALGGLGLRESKDDVLILGGRQSPAGQTRSVQDSDVVAVCLAVRSFARATPTSPLVYLNLAGEAEVTCEGAKAVAAVLQVPCGLHTIVLRHTNVSDEGAAALGAALGGSAVSVLDLGACAITDAGAKLFARGIQIHGSPRSLSTLLLDGNNISDVGIVELIMLLEGPKKPPSLKILSVQPAGGIQLSMEVDAALRVVCKLCGIELREGLQHPVPLPHTDSGVGGNMPFLVRSLQADDEPTGFDIPDGTTVRSSFGDSAASAVNAKLPGTPGLSAIHTPATPHHQQQQHSRTSGHLAAWMASTDREIRELKWMLGANIARFDAQHARLMGELSTIKAEVEMLAQGDVRSCASKNGDDKHLEALEARFDALEQVVGWEQSECSRIWQVIEAAASAAAPQSGEGCSAT